MKKIKYLVPIILIVYLTWYLFIKPYDYLVSFKVKTFPGTINQSIKTWSYALDDSSIIEQDDLHILKQKISFKDSTYMYKWEINALNDSTSKVKVYITDINHSLMNKITIPFGYTDFEKRTKKSILDFHNKLNEHIKKFKITIEGESKLKSTYCVFVPIEGRQIGKASGMMQNYSLLSTILVENNVELNGYPFVEITYWNMTKDSIHYNFCYPIIKSDSLPKHKLIKYKQFEGKNALKAIYNGNYITSDRAWYALINYAKKNNIEIEKKPVEIFYNNPNLGGNELDWKAEIYLPIK